MKAVESKSVTLILGVIGIASLMAQSVHAGKERGGGVVFVCQNGRSTRHVQVHLADTYAIKETPLYRSFRNMKAEDAKAAIGLGLESEDPSLRSLLYQAIEALQFAPQDEELPLLGDDGIDAVPSGCMKRQVAIQDYSSGIVRIDRELHSKLSDFDKEALRLHEGYLRLMSLAEDVSDSSHGMERVRGQVMDWAQRAFSARQKAIQCALASRVESSSCSIGNALVSIVATVMNRSIESVRNAYKNDTPIERLGIGVTGRVPMALLARSINSVWPGLNPRFQDYDLLPETCARRRTHPLEESCVKTTIGRLANEVDGRGTAP